MSYKMNKYIPPPSSSSSSLRLMYSANRLASCLYSSYESLTLFFSFPGAVAAPSAVAALSAAAGLGGRWFSWSPSAIQILWSNYKHHFIYKFSVFQNFKILSRNAGSIFTSVPVMLPMISKLFSTQYILCNCLQKNIKQIKCMPTIHVHGLSLFFLFLL